MKLNQIKFSLACLLLGGAGISSQAFKYSGGDISLYPDYENSSYYDPSGKSIKFLDYCRNTAGMNAMRVRLFVDPDNYKSSNSDYTAYHSDCVQDYDYILPLCKQIKEAGCALMLDFHYSDTWADPEKQWTPKSWLSLSDDQLYTKIYDYTKLVLEMLAKDGIYPDLIQTGNEISYGMCWGTETSTPWSDPYTCKIAYTTSTSAQNLRNLARFKNLLDNAIRACREVCPEAKIIIHSERIANVNSITSYYDWMKSNNIDYDVIGLSYYPYYHCNLSTFESNLKTLVNKNYGKEIMVVETGHPYKWSMGSVSLDYSVSESGQNSFSQKLVSILNNYPVVTGLFWWEMEYNPVNKKTISSNLSSNWYGAPLVNGDNGRVLSALSSIGAFGDGTDISPYNVSYKWYDSAGNKLAEPGASIKLGADSDNVVQVGVSGNPTHIVALQSQYTVYKSSGTAYDKPAVLGTDYQVVDSIGKAVSAYSTGVNNMIKFLQEGDYYVEANLPSGSCYNFFSIENAGLYINVTSDLEVIDPDPEDPDDDDYPDFYLLANTGTEGWEYPALQFNHVGKGIYTLSDIYICASGNTKGWAGLSTVGDKWSEDDNDHYGPASRDLTPEFGVATPVVQGGSKFSWELPEGNYDFTFDYNNMTLTVTVHIESPAWSITPGPDIYNQSGTVDDDERTINMVTINPDGVLVYIYTPEETDNLYALVTPASTPDAAPSLPDEPSLTSLALDDDSHSLVTNRDDDGAFLVNLPVGKGTLSLYHDDQQNPTTYTYTVTNGTPLGVEITPADDDSDALWFTLQGVRIANPGRGLYIKVVGNKATKTVRN